MSRTPQPAGGETWAGPDQALVAGCLQNPLAPFRARDPGHRETGGFPAKATNFPEDTHAATRGGHLEQVLPLQVLNESGRPRSTVG